MSWSAWAYSHDGHLVVDSCLQSCSIFACNEEKRLELMYSKSTLSGFLFLYYYYYSVSYDQTQLSAVLLV